MDFTSALRPDVYRIFITTLVPGFVGIAPWLAGVFWPELQYVETWARSGVLVPISATLFGFVLAAGFICEDLGSRVELAWADKWLERRCRRLASNWKVYLGQRRDSELIAQGYLRAILLRFKFELSMIPATFSCLLGVLASECLGNGFGRQKAFLICFGLSTLLLWLLFEVRGGAAVLAKTRQIIIRSKRECKS